MRILIAEDDQVLADGLLRSLRASGYAVDQVGSGTEADDDVDGADFARLMRHLHAFAGDKPVWMGKAAQQLKTDYVSKTPKHAACYNFLVDSGVKLAGDGASNSLGRYLHKFKGKTQRMPDGKLVQLCLGKDEDGSFFRLDAVG